MEVTFHLHRLVEGHYQPRTITEQPKEGLQLMPEGCYCVSQQAVHKDQPPAIIAIDAVLFLAIVTLDHPQLPPMVECYSIEEPMLGSVAWRPADEVHIYFYGSYRQTCALLGQTPQPLWTGILISKLNKRCLPSRWLLIEAPKLTE